jgi:hypothetical protein
LCITKYLLSLKNGEQILNNLTKLYFWFLKLILVFKLTKEYISNLY